MDEKRIAAAARLLLAVRAGAPMMAEFPPGARPDSEAEAYEVQDRVMAVLGPSQTFKVGAKGGVGPRTAAPIPADLVRPGPARYLFNQFGSVILELELAYRIGRDLPPRDKEYSAEEVTDAIDTVLPAIEIASSRFHDYRAVDRFSQLADNQNCGAFVYGSPVVDWRGIDPRALAARLTIDGKVVADTVGRHKMGDPLPLVVWFANQQSARGRTLAAGSIVTTGSFTGSITLEGPARVEGDLAGVGAVAVDLG